MKNEKNKAKEKNSVINTTYRLKIVYWIFGVIVFLFVTYHGFNYYLDVRIESKINDADFLKKLAKSIRPSLVFDVNGSIIADMGAAPYISDISVSKKENVDFEIIVTPIEHLDVEPILESLDRDFTIKAIRGQKFEWIFQLKGIKRLAMVDSAKYEKQRFRLELIR